MKQLVCEMCGSTDLIKQDGVFVCQNCGTKYSVEEARKMMIEGTVDVQGTVVINRADDAAKFRKLALDAFEADNYDEALTYADRAIGDFTIGCETLKNGGRGGKGIGDLRWIK